METLKNITGEQEAKRLTDLANESTVLGVDVKTMDKENLLIAFGFLSESFQKLQESRERIFDVAENALSKHGN